MSKVAVVYWSSTGNTAAMATAVAEGAHEKGAEQLEEGEFEPIFTACEGKLTGKKIALFGSYGWGDGEWMRSWEDICRSDGAVFACGSVIYWEAPDEEACPTARLWAPRWRKDYRYFAQNNELAFPNKLVSMMKLG